MFIPRRQPIYRGGPAAGRTASQAQLADPTRSGGGDLAASPADAGKGSRVGGQGTLRVSLRDPWGGGGGNPSALRTFQRRVLSWRLQHGQDKEVFFEQEHFPGRVMQLDWTNAKALRVTIQGRLLEHLLCHSVLPYSNWEWATRCQSESLLSLRHGLQESLHRLGAAPARLQIDNSSAATHRVGSGGREFNPDFPSVVQHYGMKPQTIGIDGPDHNGDVESQNGHLKRRL